MHKRRRLTQSADSEHAANLFEPAEFNLDRDTF
jgi:hypothetical protein